MIKAAIMGADSYNAGELIRLLVNHPDVTLEHVQSSRHGGRAVADVHRGLVGDTDLKFEPELSYSDIDILFCATPNGLSSEYFASHPIPEQLRVVDLSTDFRDADEASGWVYGLSELNRKPMVHGARLVASPGSFAMTIELALLPLANNLLLNGPIHITAITGATAEGEIPSEDTHFPHLNDNVVVFDPLTHRHLDEITRTLRRVQSSFCSEIDFVPMRGGFSRGILATIYLDCNVDIPTLNKLYEDTYDDHNFTFLLNRRPDLKDVAGTNKCLIHLEKAGQKLMITAAIDNLLKGGAGNAVHCMNLLFGLHERTGLRLKATAY